MIKASKISRADRNLAVETSVGSALQAASREFLEAARLVEKKNWKELLPLLQSAGTLLAAAGSELQRQSR